MILSIQLYTTACDPGCNRTYDDTFYISPQALEGGVRVDYCLPSQYLGFVRPIHAQTSSDVTGIEIQSADYGDRILKAGDGRTYRTPPASASAMPTANCASNSFRPARPCGTSCAPPGRALPPASGAKSWQKEPACGSSSCNGPTTCPGCCPSPCPT